MTDTTPRSILDHLRQGVPFGLSSRITLQGEELLAIGLDNGNDAAKISLLSAAGKPVTLRIPTAHQPARTFQGGAGEVTYQLGGESGFWIGEAALRNEGRALRVGSTATRLVDGRHTGFLAGCLVEALREAGYPAGSYSLAIGFAVPNGEIVRESADSDKMIVQEETKQALRKLRGAEWNITRTDERGHASHWQLTIKQLIPQAQSLGTFICWSKSPLGTTITDYQAVSVLDIGGGDLQETTISLKPYRMSSTRRGDGTIDIARGLRERLPKAALNDVTAQAALVSRQVLMSGKMVKVDKDVQAVVATYGSDLVGKLLEVFRDTRRYLVITGGGVILLGITVRELLGAAGKEAGTDYEIIPAEWASVLNSVGALFAVLFATAKKQ
ncbi:MAG TPA: hypothetical protein VFS21_29710 [Roseiflexaceae bacterium]|nr:hypothetical protein [Roseiflexaceae bacterium]